MKIKRKVECRVGRSLAILVYELVGLTNGWGRVYRLHLASSSEGMSNVDVLAMAMKSGVKLNR
jgi:hypothetical protein